MGFEVAVLYVCKVLMVGCCRMVVYLVLSRVVSRVKINLPRHALR